MAGIIGTYDKKDDLTLKGVAFKSRIVNVKVGAYDGSVDVSQVIAAIDWVVQHKNDNGLNIRVINLSFGTDGTQDPALAPLSFAVEQAWKNGIVVVVGGTDGLGVPLNNPATNPYVIAVGATDINADSRTSNDSVADFSSCGVGRTVDLVAPGKSIMSLYVPNSTAALDHPTPTSESTSTARGSTCSRDPDPAKRPPSSPALLLSDGDRVEIDGAAGTVEVIQRSAESGPAWRDRCDRLPRNPPPSWGGVGVSRRSRETVGEGLSVTGSTPWVEQRRLSRPLGKGRVRVLAYGRGERETLLDLLPASCQEPTPP